MSTPWHEDDEFWAAAGTTLFRPAAWEEATAHSRPLARLLELAPGARILDLGCGPGRYAIALANLGYRVTGVDRTPAFLDEAARRAEAAGVELELVRADMREFSRPGGFDAAISMLTSFGYFEDPAEDLKVVRNVHSSLSDGGAFLVDTYGKEVLARIYQARDWEEREGDVWLFERRVQDAWSWMENRWILIRDGQRREFRLGHRLFAAAELERLLREGGFAAAASYGDLDGSPYDAEARRLVTVGRK